MTELVGLIAGKSGDSLTDELHKRNYQVVLICGRKGEPGSSNADYVLIEDLSNTEAIYLYLAKMNINRVIIGTGHILAFNLAAELSKKGIVTNIDLEKSFLAKNKWAFKEALKQINIKTPEAYLIENSNQLYELDLPLVIKSVNDKYQPVKVSSKTDIKSFIEEHQPEINNDPMMAEEFIDGYDCTVAITNSGKNIECFGITYYSKAKEYHLKGFSGGKTKKFPHEIEQSICDIAITIVSKLDFTGLVRIDFIVDCHTNDIYVLELNTVIVTGYNGSAYPFFINNGINISSKFIDTALSLLG